MMVNDDDDDGHLQSTKSLKEYTTDGFELGTRAEVLKMMKDEPMVVGPLQPEEDPDIDIVLSFRSQIVCDDDQ